MKEMCIGFQGILTAIVTRVLDRITRWDLILRELRELRELFYADGEEVLIANEV